MKVSFWRCVSNFFFTFRSSESPWTQTPGTTKPIVVILNALVISQLARSVQPALKNVSCIGLQTGWRTWFIHNRNCIWNFVSFSFSPVTEINGSNQQRQSKLRFQIWDPFQMQNKNWLQFPLSLYFRVSHRKTEPKLLLKWHCQEWQTWIRLAWHDLNYWFMHIHHILAMKYTTPALWSVSDNNILNNLNTILPVWKTKVLHKWQ